MNCCFFSNMQCIVGAAARRRKLHFTKEEGALLMFSGIGHQVATTLRCSNAFLTRSANFE